MHISFAERLEAHAAVSRALERLTSDKLAELLAGGQQLGLGIGGSTTKVTVEGVGVFAKKIPLTDLEMIPENRQSTANVFELPTFYQYPIGSAGFGAWRELAAHILTTDWVKSGGFPGFPLMHHWRIIPSRTPQRAGLGGFDDIEQAVAFWDESAEVRHRLEAIGAAAHSVVVFTEYLPHRLRDWLVGSDADFERAEAQLAAGLEFMRERGFVHFDAHFGNLLTDGKEVYFSDFGLAVCNELDLSEVERRFLVDHRDYDRAYVGTGFAALAVDSLRGDVRHLEFLRAWMLGAVDRSRLDFYTAELVDRYAPLAVSLLEFHRALRAHEKAALRWPSEEVRKALAIV